MKIGPHTINPIAGLAPMAGVTDKPFRLLCKRLGGRPGGVRNERHRIQRLLEQRPSRARAWTMLRRARHGERTDRRYHSGSGWPRRLATTSRTGSDINRYNMGCPGKKVCKAWAGSALMQDEALVERITQSRGGCVDVPVTLQIRTGWAAECRNAPVIGRLAEDAGIPGPEPYHGRTRDQKYTGQAEYETIAAIKQQISIPVLANVR